jgi:tRNA A-37 threonylcarbamoyl transferase component Bud32
MALSRLSEALADRYTIERELGAGGMATVYLAQDIKHDRHVAIKVLRPELAASIGSDRFLREIRIAAQLQHPHILPLLESGEAQGFLFYVMPYVDGQSLRDRLVKQGELPVHEAVKLISEIVDALSYAHGRGVVHRDVKPDNVMLSGRHALVMDFGVAKAVSEASGKNQLTTAGVALGTPAYMAPEQAAADPHLDHRVDIYAVGVMGYELLAGRPPFVGGSPQQVLAAHVTQAPEPLSRFRPGVSPALESAIMRCLAKRPADRWQSAHELLTQLEPLVTPSAGMTPTSTRPIEGYRAPVKRRWLIAGSALVGALALGTTWVLMGNGASRRLPPVQLERTQLTFTGNAFYPTVTKDGQRVAYATRQCDASGRCVNDVVVQDVAGAGSAVILKGVTALWGLEWTADGRFLIMTGSYRDHWGVFSLAALGGEPRYLGCCAGNMVNASDTVLLMGFMPGTDSLVRLRWVTIIDGIARDSISIPADNEGAIVARQLPDGRHLLLEYPGRGGTRLVRTDRKGTRLDSMALSPFQSLLQVAADGRSVLIKAGRARTFEADLIRLPIDRNGRIESQPDTVVRQWSANAGADVSSGGVMAYGYGPIEYSVSALSRESATSMRFRERRLAGGTATTIGTLSAAGDRALLWRNVRVGDRLLVQLSVMPFDSGPEISLGPPRDVYDKDWAQDGRTILIGVRQGDSIAMIEQDAASDRSRVLATYPRSEYIGAETLPGGGYVLVTSLRSVRRVGAPGLPDRTFELPFEAGTLSSIDPSPDGRAFVSIGWNPSYDTILVHRVSLADGSVLRLGTFAGENGEQARWLSDGSILVAVGETSWNEVWYRIPVGGGPAVRLGSPPRYPADYRFSTDGRKVLMLSKEWHSDIYLARNFGEVYRR